MLSERRGWVAWRARTTAVQYVPCVEMSSESLDGTFPRRPFARREGRMFAVSRPPMDLAIVRAWEEQPQCKEVDVLNRTMSKNTPEANFSVARV